MVDPTSPVINLELTELAIDPLKYLVKDFGRESDDLARRMNSVDVVIASENPVYLALLDRLTAPERERLGRSLAHSTTTKQVQELPKSIRADRRTSSDAVESQTLESQNDPGKDPPHSLGSLDGIRQLEEGISTCDHTKFDDATGLVGRDSGPQDTAHSRTSAPRRPLREKSNDSPSESSHVPQRTFCNTARLRYPVPRRPHAIEDSRLSDWVRELRDVSSMRTPTGSRSHTPSSSVGVFITAPNSPRRPKGIMSTEAKSGEKSCRITSTIDNGGSAMPSLLPSHIQDLHHPDMPGSFPSDNKRQRDTQREAPTSQGTLRAPTTSVNYASQTLHQTDHRSRDVVTHPRDGQSLEPSTKFQRGPPRRQRKDDSWRREA